jgi:hypothetical protein
MFRKQTLREAAAETTHTAAERGAAALDAAIERIQPLLEQAAERVGPFAEDAKKRADDARTAAAKYAADTLDSVQPQLNEALDRVTPAVEKAQKAVQNDLIPKLIQLLHEAAEHPAVAGVLEDARDAAAEIESRGQATLAAVKGELELPKKSSKGKTFLKVAAVGALLAAAGVAIKTFLGSKDSGWAPHEPSPAYTYTDTPTPKDPEPEDPEDDLDDDLEDEGVDAEATDATEATAPTTFGEGSYIGTEPPEGYTIKGNDRSMKYHVQESGGYERTNADVWFNSEEAAQAAGFTRAQR